MDNSVSVTQKKNQDLQSESSNTVHEEDKIIIQNILTGLDHLGTEAVPICRQYKVISIPIGYMIYARLPSQDVFEISTEDLLFIQSISPARIEHISVARTSQGAQQLDLCIKVLNHEQKVMIKSSTTFYSHSTRKRKLEEVSKH